MKDLTKHIRYTNLTVSATLEAYIDTNNVNIKTLKDRIQIASVGILCHLGKHGDKPTACRLATKQLTGLGQGMQAKALQEWFSAFGAEFDAKSKNFIGWDIDKMKSLFNANSTNPKNIREGARGTHWIAFAPADEWSGLKFDTVLAQMFTKVDKALSKVADAPALADKVVIDMDKYTLLKDISSFNKEQVAEMMALVKTQSSTETVIPGEASIADFDFDAEPEVEEVKKVA